MTHNTFLIQSMTAALKLFQSLSVEQSVGLFDDKLEVFVLSPT